MRLGTVTARLAALPTRHKAIAALVAASAALAIFAWSLLVPQDYASFAVISLDLPESVGAAKMPPAALVQAILLDSEPRMEAQSLRQHLEVATLAPRKLRIAWTGRSAIHTQETAEALIGHLALWQLAPQSNKSDSAGAKFPTLSSEASQLDPNRERSLLRVTLGLVNARQAAATAELSRLHPPKQPSQTLSNRKAGLVREIGRLRAQRRIVASRLAEAEQPFDRQDSQAVVDRASITSAKPMPTAVATPVYPFTVLAGPSTPTPLRSFPSPAVALFAGLFAGLIYLAAALWRFRPLLDRAALEKLLSGEIPLLGVIGDIHS